MCGPWPVGLSGFVKGACGGGGPGVKPAGLPLFGFLLLQHIYLTYIWFVIVSDSANPYLNELTSGQVWRGPPNLAELPN
jgi:hypothetical protein